MFDTDLWQPSQWKIVPQWFLEWLVQRSGILFQETDLQKRYICMRGGKKKCKKKWTLQLV